MPFDYTSGNPDNLTGGAPARMQDVQGPFYDIRAWLNSSTGGGAAAGGFVDVTGGPGAPVLDVGMLGQRRAGRQLANADFTAMGLAVPLGLWNLGDLTDASGNGRALVNKGTVPFGVGVNGLSTTAAQFAGSTGQALYIADTGAADPFRIRTGSVGCWFRTAKRAVSQYLVTKYKAGAGNAAWLLGITTNNVAHMMNSADGSALVDTGGVSDVCDDRWHFAVFTFDGTTNRLYIDGTLETQVAGTPAFQGAAPLNIGGFGADGSTAATDPNYGRVDEAFVTADVLTDDQIRLLYCAKIPHTLGAAPTRVKLNVRRQRKGGAFATTDFPATPVRLHNFTAGALTDQGTGGVTLATNPGSGAQVSVAGADGALGGAYSFSGAHAGLSATDAGLPAGTATRSYGCWFKTTDLTGASHALVAWATASTEMLYASANGAINSVNNGDFIAGPFVADGQWHLAVMVEDSAAGDGIRRKMYLDGRLVGGSTVLNSITLIGANGFRVGANTASADLFTGQIDAVFVTGVALTMEQVAALYAKGAQALTPSPKNPGDHVEAMDAVNVLAVFDTLDSQHQVDLGVAA